MATPRRTKITIALIAAVVLAAAVLTGGLWAQKEYRQYVLFYDAVGAGDTARVRAFLKQGVNINARGYWKETPLSHAALFHQADMVRLLLEAGADVNAQDETGQTALYSALIAFPMDDPKRWPSVLDTVKTLVQAGARIDLAGTNGQNARQWAERRVQGLKQNPKLYASFQQSGYADPTPTVRALIAVVLAKRDRAP